MKPGSKTSLSLEGAYRLDFTVDALRRLSANIVDRYDASAYRRILGTPSAPNPICVRQSSPQQLSIVISGPDADSQVSVVRHMLGTDADLRAWYRRCREFPWIAALAQTFRGLRPPCYPTLWEALCHSIVFQQLSIVAAASMMRRFVEALSRPFITDGVELYPFPSPQAVLRARANALLSAGLSRSKASYIYDAAEAVAGSALSAQRIEALPTPAAAAELRSLRGIGPWSASVMLLRGLGRLDAFPLNDSGVSRSIKILSGDPHVDIDHILEKLGDARGMLYFHLLLGMRRRMVHREGLEPPTK